jgi:aryl carrier-like protein
MNQGNAALEWERLMRAGRFADAWTVSDSVLSRAVPHDPTRPRHAQTVWRGEPFTGRRVLVRCYHGLGDTIQFVRFARMLRRAAAEVTLWAQPALLPLIARVDGVDIVESLTDGAPLTSYDVDVEIMELAHALRAEPCDVTFSDPYIQPVTPCPHAARAALDTRSKMLRVGVAWRGGDWDRARDIPSASLAPLAEIPGIRFFSFQPDSRDEAESIGATDLGHLNVVEIASVLPHMDLVISADTMLAHLAGAMARPTWTLLPARCDWRWMNAGSRTPWYPTMRLFRQNADSWANVVESVRLELNKILHGTSSI